MTYEKQTWNDAPATDTPVSATRLNHMETGIEAADSAATAATAAVSDKASASDLTSGLSTKANTTHAHTSTDVTGLDTTLSTKANSSDLAAGLATKANTTDLTSGLATKASSSDLSSGLATKANTTHAHAISDVTGLTAALASASGGSSVSAWAPSTAYAVGDIVIYSDGVFRVATAHTSPATFSMTNLSSLNPGHLFNVMWYGAQGNGVADDTAAIQNAINAAVAYGAANSGYGEVYIPPASAYYAIKGSLVSGGTTKGNAQITLPIVAMTANKVTLVIRGVNDSSALPTWLQASSTVYQRTGSVLRTNATATDTTGTLGSACVIGGPTPIQGYGSSAGVFNNLHVVIDGIEIVTPNTTRGSDMSGIDLRGCAEATVKSLACLVDQPPASGSFVTAEGKGSGWSFGLALPSPANNAKNNVFSYSAEAFTYGILATEHLAAVNVISVYCYTGILIIGSFENTSGAQHVAWIGNACVEACTNGVMFIQGGKAIIEVMTVEGSFAGNHVVDTNGSARGYVGLGGIINTISVSDPCGVEVKYIDGKAGLSGPPTIPATTVALRNPYWRNATVYVSGGTVTNISVNGTTTGMTSGAIRVPSGQKIAMTYSSAPTWIWIAD